MQFQESVGYMEERGISKHKISLWNRNSGMIGGVREVISFDPGEIVLDTEQGILAIYGEDLRVTKLTVEKGEVEMQGMVESMIYTDGGQAKKEKGSIRKRLFR